MTSQTGTDRQDFPPEGVTDPMLWRLAVSVAEEHRGAEQGHCRNLQCADQPQPCAPWTWAQRAMELAYQQGQTFGYRPASARARQAPRRPDAAAA
ncbi:MULTISPECIES: hypothetical protein [Micromonospora]|uniref:Uncharacterized protein n=1 Tax=Micromonospora yangpuensis TaxID=683228 RepID=A0A1C6UU02_9ACTN|nr:hypothetical protein [Micromonospora yangpuensis]GGM24459.1 hypothetical protein GCM10012279_48510 [Micromonospora yangpuensis]SCL57517.1 hypothetical protein GA0070617_3549 [Micromonospora yangpuensis]